MATVEIPLTNSDRVAIVDAEDAALVAGRKWRLHCGRYAAHSTTVNGKTIITLMHRLICPDGKQVDHVNGDGLDNRRANVRPATSAQNLWNIAKPRTNTSGFKGVTYQKRRGRWEARIRVNGEKRQIGTFDTPEQAARAYDDAARRLHGEFARLNFPEAA